MTRSMTAAIVVAMLMIAACTSSRGPGPSTTPAPAATSAEATHSSSASAAVSATPIPPASAAPSQAIAKHLTTDCFDNSPCVLAAGTWVTFGDNAFVPGMAITVPDGWTSPTANAGELKLIPSDHPDDAVFIWEDVAAIESNGGTPKILSGVPRTADGLTASFRKNPDFVVSTPAKTTIGDGITALTYVIGVSKAARYTSLDCPSHPACANILRDPVHWGPTDFYAIGAPEVVRLYLATVGVASDRHLLVIGLDATDPVELERLTAVAAEIIASIRLPAAMSGQ